MSKGECIICGEEAEIAPANFGFGDFISCKTCGKFIIDISAENYISNNKIEKNKFYACLYYYFLHFKKERGIYVIVDNVVNINDNLIQISVDEIMNLYPKTMSEKINKILLNLSVILKDLGQSYNLKEPESLRVFMAKDYTEVDFLLKTMVDEFKYIKGDIVSSYIARLQLTYKGWNKIDEISKDIKKYKKGFIAMWFDESMLPVRQIIKEVFIETGYQISIIDEKEHNNQIVPEILYEIQTSDFIVADLTGNRKGVYYEAGYALGLGKEVILMTDITKIDREKNSPHFDVAQVNQVRYESVEDLKAKLFNRITSTVGNLKNPNAKLKPLPLKKE